jgi:hypothetical protein
VGWSVIRRHSSQPFPVFSMAQKKSGRPLAFLRAYDTQPFLLSGTSTH